jgi:hypothetical protein
MFHVLNAAMTQMPVHVPQPKDVTAAWAVMISTRS